MNGQSWRYFFPVYEWPELLPCSMEIVGFTFWYVTYCLGKFFQLFLVVKHYENIPSVRRFFFSACCPILHEHDHVEKKFLFPKYSNSNGHLECSFDNLAENFQIKVQKFSTQSRKLFAQSPKSFQFIFFFQFYS